MPSVRTLARGAAPVVLIPLYACFSPPVASPRTTVNQETSVRVNENIKDKVDILFMVDNSSSMDPMQLELRARFGDFLKVFEDLAQSGTYADLQIGVVTSDYGAGDASSPGSGCDVSPGGQNGILQTLPSPNAVNPPAGCMAPVGAPFIKYKFNAGGPPTTNLPNGSDATALENEFTCMASVGAKGCGFEHQLESVYAALHNTKENAGFLRDQALLAVVFVTNEDDGSAAPTAKFYEAPPGGSDPMGTSMYGQFTTYRQTRFAIDCSGMPIAYGVPSMGALAGCAAAPNPTMDPSLAYDIQRYINFLTQPATLGGVKLDPENDVILVGLDGPESPFETVLIDPSQGNTPYHLCPSPMLSSSCNMALQHSCENAVQPGFFADPAVRLNAVVRSAKHSEIASICGDDPAQAPDYTSTMQKVGELISSQIQPGCLDAPIAARTDDGTPDCSVVDVTLHPDGPPTQAPVASCAENGGTPPCWQVIDLLPQYQTQGCVPPPGPKPMSCMLPIDCQPVVNPLDGKEQLVSVSINRGGQPPPAGSTVQVSCTTIVSSM